MLFIVGLITEKMCKEYVPKVLVAHNITKQD